jgi:hypothetical protein
MFMKETMFAADQYIGSSVINQLQYSPVVYLIVIYHSVLNEFG